ncbi:MAG: hypothetical protein P1U34_11165 [Coxiellaceae bacterium]|nr:hypothetical protein [Coxiellaceae bacterium]
MRSAASSTAIIPYQAPLFGAGAVIADDKKRAFRFLKHALTEPRISISELFWLADDEELTHGEAAKAPLSDSLADDELARLHTHIDSLMQFAADHHRSAEHSKYHITRLSMPEYSLFTSTPLNETQLTELSAWLDKQAKKLPENVHVLLSTVAVAMNNELYNVAFYITGGVDARVRTIIKSQPSPHDFTYDDQSGLTLFQMLPGAPDTFRPTIAHGQLPESHSLETTKPLANSPCFNVTVADTQLQVFVEICYDQPEGTALKHLEHSLRDISPPMPRYCSNIVSANTTDICQDLRITPQLTHVDALRSKHHPHYCDERCLTKVTDAVFGGAYSIYNFGTHDSDELDNDYEALRRRLNRILYEEKLEVSLSDLDITIEIDRALRTGQSQYAINLLQLLESPEPALIIRLASHHLLELPSLELNYMAMRAHSLADTQILVLAQRANELSTDALEYIYELIDDGHLKPTAPAINLFCQQAYRLTTDIDIPFFEPKFIDHLDAQSIASCTRHFKNLNSQILNIITQRFFTALTPPIQHELIALSWLLNADSLAIICEQHDALSEWEINVLCQQAKRLSDDSLSQLLTHTDLFNSQSKFLIDNEAKHRKSAPSHGYLMRT